MGADGCLRTRRPPPSGDGLVLRETVVGPVGQIALADQPVLRGVGREVRDDRTLRVDVGGNPLRHIAVLGDGPARAALVARIARGVSVVVPVPFVPGTGEIHARIELGDDERHPGLDHLHVAAGIGTGVARPVPVVVAALGVEAAVAGALSAVVEHGGGHPDKVRVAEGPHVLEAVGRGVQAGIDALRVGRDFIRHLLASLLAVHVRAAGEEVEAEGEDDEVRVHLRSPWSWVVSWPCNGPRMVY